MNNPILFSEDDDYSPEIAAGLPIDDGPLMTTFPDPTPAPSASPDMLQYYKSKGLSLDLAQRLVDGIEESGSFEADPVGAAASELALRIVTTPDAYSQGLRDLAAAYERQREYIAMQDSPDTANIPPEDLVVAIIARPGNYDACLLGLAHAYESQRERISDLEDDVERLRPREVPKDEVLFKYVSSKTEIIFYTEDDGGIYFAATDPEDDSQVASEIPRDEFHQLTTALAKWAGLDGVEWRILAAGEKPKEVEPLVDVILTDGSRTVVTCWSPDWNGWAWHTGRPTHWSPLPKPPVVK